MQSFKNRLQSLFRGMVEPKKTLSVDIKDGPGSRLDETLSFTHRSAYDFLQRRRHVDPDRPGVDAKAAVLYCLMVRVSQGWDAAGRNASVCQMVNTLVPLLPWFVQSIADEQTRLSYFESLAEIDDILVRQQLDIDEATSLQFPVSIAESGHLRHPLPLGSSRLIVSIFSIACCMRLYDYTDWIVGRLSSWVWKDRTRISLVESLCWTEQRYHQDGSLIRLIQRLLEDGEYANVLDEYQSPWGTCLTLAGLSPGFYTGIGSHWQVILILLQHGANPDVIFWNSRGTELLTGQSFGLSIAGWRCFLSDRSILLPPHLEQHKLRSGDSLRDLCLRCCGPKEKDDVLRAIDKSLRDEGLGPGPEADIGPDEARLKDSRESHQLLQGLIKAPSLPVLLSIIGELLRNSCYDFLLL